MLEKYWDQDTWLVKQKTKWVLIVFGIFFMSMFFSCQELRYMISGKVVDAGASMREEILVERSGEKVKHTVISYTYIDGDKQYSQNVEQPAHWSGINAGTAKVEYIPGRDISRLQGQSNKVWVGIFIGSLVVSIFGAYILVKTV